ncbi:PPOX class F420-dependent oxidoreductase [Frankia sp. R82]|uniref:PPOX class F420-dependent oxidoreductase n=1 Tax=Frankia sp. R82 TaxID=2950553 RepID=UPI002044A383|nr:PPOX class F420-dependent oxidoreductase [Frankia sp. R82]MCM3884396.1 PPOX class F420-dependent oxidoreductase [Frankia sp. R82]
MPIISPSHRDLLEKPITVVLATVGRDGQPQVTAVWAILDSDSDGGDVVLISVTKDRQKYRNLAAHPQATLFVLDPANPQRTLEIRATAEIGDDPGLEVMKRVLAHYGADLAGTGIPTNDRVAVTLRPTRIVELG